MQRTTTALVAVAALALGALGTSLVLRPAPGLDAAAVRAIVSEALEARAPEPAPAQTAALDPSALEPVIEDYLLANPRLLERMSQALQAEMVAEESARNRQVLAAMHADIYEDPDHVVLGNPEGDVTLVEMFDYNCGYCRQAMPVIAELLAEDPGLRVILKEFPILSADSIDAARIAVVAGRELDDYWPFHEALFTARGQVTGQTALGALEDLGLNRAMVTLDADDDSVSSVIERSYRIAQALDISGTPTFILGNEVIPGAMSAEQLRMRIANMRACGETFCEG